MIAEKWQCPTPTELVVSAVTSELSSGGRTAEVIRLLGAHTILRRVVVLARAAHVAEPGNGGGQRGREAMGD